MKSKYTINTVAVFANARSRNPDIFKTDLVASIQYRINFMDNILPLEIVRFNNIEIRRNKDLIIYRINRDPEMIEPVVTTYCQFWNDILRRSESIEVINISSKKFFTRNYTEKLFLDEEYDWTSKLFIFDDTPWNTLVNKFKSLNISLSGGSTVKRHLLSPTHMRLSRFLLILEGHEKSYQRTMQSFELNTTIHGNNSIKKFSKNPKIWKIRNIFKNVEGYTKKWDENLFLIFKNYQEKLLEYWEKILSDEIKNKGNTLNAINVEKFLSKYPIDKRDKFNPKIMTDFFKKLEKYDNKYHYKTNINNEDDDD